MGFSNSLSSSPDILGSMMEPGAARPLGRGRNGRPLWERSLPVSPGWGSPLDMSPSPWMQDPESLTLGTVTHTPSQGISLRC